MTVTALRGSSVARRKIEAGIAQRGAYAFAAFFHGNIRQADEGEKTFHYRDYVHFDFDELGADAEHGCAERLEEHPKMPFESSIPEEGVSSYSTVEESLSQNGR